MERVLAGILDMNRLPKAIFLVDAKREETAVREAGRLGIPLVALVDTNSNPDPIAYVIPGNDDAIRSIQMVTSLIADAILEGHQAYQAGVAEQAEKVAAEKARGEAKERQEEQEREEREAAQRAPAAQSPDEIAELDPLSAPVAGVDDVEAIIPDAALKTKIEIEESKRKKAPKAKPAKEPEKGKAGG